MTNQTYHQLIPGRIYMGGAGDVQNMVEQEGVEVVVDLREEAQKCAADSPNVAWVQIPLGDEAHEPQEKLLHKAVQEVVSAYHAGKKVAFHCGGGKGRTGTVAYGTLLELGLAETVEEAEAKAKEIRPILNIKPAQRQALEALYGAGVKKQ
jgi:protein-tyrosine phosphatase